MHGEYELRWQAVRGAEFYELEEVERESGATRTLKLEDTRYAFAAKPVGQYVYRVRACHAFACSEWSNEQLAIVAPLAPTQAPELQVEGPDVTHRLMLAWTRVHNADEYMLETADDEGFRNARIHTQAETTFSLVRREPGDLYFRVKGLNPGGEGPWSEVVHVSLLAEAPTWIEATPSKDGRRAEIAWGAVGGRGVTYVLQMLVTTEMGVQETPVYQGEDTHCTLDLPQDADHVVFRVRAEHPPGQSDWQLSDPIALRPGLPAPRLNPPEVEPDGRIRLTWESVPGASHYVIEVGRNPEFTGSRQAERPETTISVSPPVSGKYWFRVRACRGEQSGPSSNVMNIKVDRPASPRLWPVDAVQANMPFEIAWEGMPGCTYYELQEADSDRFEPGKTRMAQVMHPSQKYTVSGRPAGHCYYRVRAVDEHDRASAWSNVVQVDVQAG
jgi:predicted phage tail protein